MAFLAAGLAHGSDCMPLPCSLQIGAQGSAEATAATQEAQRTESVTLRVRGMMKSRSGAT